MGIKIGRGKKIRPNYTNNRIKAEWGFRMRLTGNPSSLRAMEKAHDISTEKHEDGSYQPGVPP